MQLTACRRKTRRHDWRHFLRPTPALGVAGLDANRHGPPLCGGPKLPQFLGIFARHLVDALHHNATTPGPALGRCGLHRVQPSIVDGKPSALTHDGITACIVVDFAVGAAQLGSPRDHPDGGEGRHKHRVVRRRPRCRVLRGEVGARVAIQRLLLDCGRRLAQEVAVTEVRGNARLRETDVERIQQTQPAPIAGHPNETTRDRTRPHTNIHHEAPAVGLKCC
mmetsp:Transcript_98923/g.258450  ORF Transcript_98923/g.258450 Transcript_98923/m.258450 type:complete len:222 (-) Transcript_98923:7-672(-)